MSDESMVKTGVLAQATEQFQQLWALRESIPEAVSKEGKAYKYDISVPVSTFEWVVAKTRQRLQEKGLYKTPGGVREVVGYGHIGDGEQDNGVYQLVTLTYGRKPTFERCS